MKNTRFLLAVVVIALLCVIWLAVGVTAQRGPGPVGPGGPGGGPGGPGMQPPPPPHTIKAGAEGLFVLLDGTLLKLDPTNLSQAGSLTLVERPTAQSSGDQQQPPPPPLPGAILLAGGTNEKLLVVIGNQFFNVDAASLQISAKAILPKPQVGQDPPRGPMGPPPLPPLPMLELHGTTLYVISGPQIIAININDGTILGHTMLPKPPKPEVEQ